MNDWTEQDKFLEICGHGLVDDLAQWLRQRPQFKINQPEGLNGNTGLHMAALSEENAKACSYRGAVDE